MSKDLFSSASENYSKYRPTYPPELFEFILSFVKERELCWDAATGNGQAAAALAPHFKKVIASDLSSAQLSHATQLPNIEYRNFPSESTNLIEGSVNLITVATAYHWFDHRAFSKEVKRVAASEAVIAVWAYNLLRTENEKVNSIIDDFYKNVTGPYWEKERAHVDTSYSQVPFPFDEIKVPSFQVKKQWTPDDLIGFFSTWSAVQTYIKREGTSPLPALKEKISKSCPSQAPLEVVFPLFLRLGKLGIRK